jgi:hypothetical protein
MPYAWASGAWAAGAWAAGSWGDEAAPPDTSPPIGAITAPATGATVFGTINVLGVFTDDVGVVDGRLITDGTPGALSGQSGGSFSLPVNTTLLANGAHTFQIGALDLAGNQGLSQVITLTIANLAVPPPLPPGVGRGLYPAARRRGRR